jgi:Family of unknown function (DUF5681)
LIGKPYCVNHMNETDGEYPDGEYRVGRGKPPLHTRFKKGQSGNPRGPRRKNLPALLVAALDEPVVVTTAGESRRITKREAVIAQLVDKSAGADLRATKMLIDMLKDIEKRAGITPPPERSPFTAADEEVVENLLARLRQMEPAGIHHGDTQNTEESPNPINLSSDGS